MTEILIHAYGLGALAGAIVVVMAWIAWATWPH